MLLPSQETHSRPKLSAEMARQAALASDKDRSGFATVLARFIERHKLPTEGSVLVIGASAMDAGVLQAVGFRDIVLSNFHQEGFEWERVAVVASQYKILKLDAEDIDLPDGSFDVVVAHEVLHHCRSPHRAMCELLRVCRHYVVFQDPNDCWGMRMLARLGLSFPFELAAVVDQNYSSGGVRDSNIPNFIYRWNSHEMCKVVSSFVAEEKVRVYDYAYWELNARERDLELRARTKLGLVARCVGGTRNLVRLLGMVAPLLNAVPLVRKQGNKFFCIVERTGELRDWLLRENGAIVFNRAFQRRPGE